MVSYVRDTFAPIKKIIGVTLLGTTAVSIPVNGNAITFACISGSIWINPLATAVTNETAFRLYTGQAIDLVVKGSLSIISDSSATYQAIFWDT